MSLNKEYQVVLDTLSKNLFYKDKEIDGEFDLKTVMDESYIQAVYPLVYKSLEGLYDLKPFTSMYYKFITDNLFIKQQHILIYGLLSNANIPCVILKGCASADYYPDPALRTLGDVDILVKTEDLKRATDILEKNGFEQVKNNGELHIGFKKSYKNLPQISVELHWSVNGIPDGDVGKKIENYLSDVIENSVLLKGEFAVPSPFHHGLVLLLHTSTHWIHEGVGLRHLCDWAVFISKYKEDEFINLFESRLKDVGLWNFACYLTELSTRYLGLSPYKFAEKSVNTDTDLFIEDIFAGGNFGKKDTSRYQHIKYINSFNSKKNEDNSIFSQLLLNLNKKCREEYKFVEKYPIFLPIGWLCVIISYLKKVLTHKRKFDNPKLLSDASSRKNLYNQLKLFKDE